MPQLQAIAELERRRRIEDEPTQEWPPRHVVGADYQPVPFHRGQDLASDSKRRTVAMFAGSQGGKTCYGPWWLLDELEQCGGGDHLAVTASYDLFKLKMLPALLDVYEHILGIGRYWAGDRVLELADPGTGQFWAQRSMDRMWGRVILRSADSLGGLESATARSAWLDEAGQDRFTLFAYRAVQRRLALHRGRMLITTTLYNLGWLIQQIMDPAEVTGTVVVEQIGEGELEYTDSEEADIAMVQFDSIINPAYPMEEYEDARARMPDDEFQMFYRGRRAKLRTLIYDAFDRRLHVCSRFPVPNSWNRYVGLDFGGANMAAVFYAEEPESHRLYAYREYLSGNKAAADHVRDLLEGEPGRPVCVGGSKSEGQWRLEFARGGLPVLPPDVADVSLGINRVYAQHKANGIVYFNDLTGVLDQKGRYRRKRDRQGNITDEIENKNAFHYMDAERYIISYIRPGEEGAGTGDAVAAAQESLVGPSRWGAQSGPRWTRTKWNR